MSVTDTDQRTSRLELALAIIRLMRERGIERATLEYVFTNIHTVLDLTPADRHYVPSRAGMRINSGDRYYMQDIRNISRNQDVTGPSYARYRPIPGCEALSYKRGGRSTGEFILARRDLHDMDA